MNIKEKKLQLQEFKKSILDEYKYRIKCKSCSGEILELKKQFENNKNWSLVSRSYYYNAISLKIINSSYVIIIERTIKQQNLL